MLIANFLNSSEVTTDRLFQWDIGQQIQLLNVGTSTAPNVHFCNKKSDNALVVTSSGSGGTYTVNIPNTLLAEEYDITAFVYVGDENEAKTIKVIHIPVAKRTKPSSYIYTADKDVIDFMAISAEIHSLLDGLVITPYSNTNSYKKPNIVYYNGSTYICKSETSITGVLPTDSTKWGLMCESGCNISQVTFSNNALHFKLQNDDVIDVSLNPVELTTVDNTNIPGLSITKDESGVLKIGDIVIPQRKVIANICSNTHGSTSSTLGTTVFTSGSSLFGKTIIVEVAGTEVVLKPEYDNGTCSVSLVLNEYGNSTTEWACLRCDGSKIYLQVYLETQWCVFEATGGAVYIGYIYELII